VKVVIQIPCSNDAGVLPDLLRALPRQLRRVGELDVLVVDDGSTDGTSEAARRGGVRHVLRFEKPQRRGIAFAAGMAECLRMGAGAVITLSPRLRYAPGALDAVLRPVMTSEAPVAIAARGKGEPPRARWTLSGILVRAVGGPSIPDPASGLFACDRETAVDLSHSPETLFGLRAAFRALGRGLPVAYVPVLSEPLGKGPGPGESLADLGRTLRTVLFLRSVYRPASLYFAPGMTLLTLALFGVLGAKLIAEDSPNRLIWITMTSFLAATGLMTLLFGFLAQRVANARFYMEETLRRVKLMEYGGGGRSSEPRRRDFERGHDREHRREFRRERPPREERPSGQERRPSAQEGRPEPRPEGAGPRDIMSLGEPPRESPAEEHRGEGFRRHRHRRRRHFRPRREGGEGPSGTPPQGGHTPA
jgi:hypothetical protein